MAGFDFTHQPGRIAGQNVYVESGVLPQVMWTPDNGNPGQAPINTVSAQNYVQPMRRGSPVIAAPVIGFVQWLGPLLDIWRVGLGITRSPAGPYQGGYVINNQGGMEWGVGSAPSAFPQASG